MSDFEELIRSWDGFAVVSRFDDVTKSWIFICLHDLTLGPASGGTRMKVYSSPAEGLRDAMRLAEGMTHKWAAADLKYGGGKAVLATERPLEGEERQGLLARYGDLIASLGGVFQTGEDMGTTQQDLIAVSRRTRFVHGFDASGAKADPGPYTARGVYKGMRAAIEHAFDSRDFSGRSVLIQGVGNVGLELARLLAGAGARLLLSDIDHQRLEAAATELSAEIVEPDKVRSTVCDVYAPCAVGGTLDRESIAELGSRVVAGSANNQLGKESDAQRLEERGIVWAPDFIINAGGATAFALLHDDHKSRDEILEAVDGIETTIREVLTEARERGESSLATAKRRARRTLDANRRPAL
ncbi:MAG: hypothetical protein OES47_05490 [Acidobacteriota bacterium]|nr:hypothetical protein [Acidobacteriota bacterium]